MRISVLVNDINKKLAGELLTQAELLCHMDGVIDDINAEMSTCFPTFSEVIEFHNNITDPDYTHIPDKYLRKVVTIGAAYKFYEVDEEGNNTAPAFKEAYEQGLFIMKRDFSFNVPEEYLEENQGFLNLSDKNLHGPAMRAPQNAFLNNQHASDAWPPFRNPAIPVPPLPRDNADSNDG